MADGYYWVVADGTVGPPVHASLATPTLLRTKSSLQAIVAQAAVPDCVLMLSCYHESCIQAARSRDRGWNDNVEERLFGRS
jgi:hypothetical protein